VTHEPTTFICRLASEVGRESRSKQLSNFCERSTHRDSSLGDLARGMCSSEHHDSPNGTEPVVHSLQHRFTDRKSLLNLNKCCRTPRPLVHRKQHRLSELECNKGLQYTTVLSCVAPSQARDHSNLKVQWPGTHPAASAVSG
jgi:hypothetical protein